MLKRKLHSCIGEHPGIQGNEKRRRSIPMRPSVTDKPWMTNDESMGAKLSFNFWNYASNAHLLPHHVRDLIVDLICGKQSKILSFDCRSQNVVVLAVHGLDREFLDLMSESSDKNNFITSQLSSMPVRYNTMECDGDTPSSTVWRSIEAEELNSLILWENKAIATMKMQDSLEGCGDIEKGHQNPATDMTKGSRNAAQMYADVVTLATNAASISSSDLEKNNVGDHILDRFVLSDTMLEMLGYPGEEDITYSSFADSASIRWMYQGEVERSRAKAEGASTFSAANNVSVQSYVSAMSRSVGNVVNSHKYFGDDDEEGEASDEEDAEDSEGIIGKDSNDVNNFLNSVMDTNGVSDEHEYSVWHVDGVDDASKTLPLSICAVDCEMSYTMAGLELTRITLVCPKRGVVLDTLVKPTNEIVDYNTKYSGITADMLAHVTVDLAEVHRRLRRVIDSNTVLVGHSLESDLKVLRLVHRRVCDTSALYPHPRGQPFRESLKKLAEIYLGKSIQEGTGESGHDSIQDATSALELVLLKALAFYSPPTHSGGQGNNHNQLDFGIPAPWSGRTLAPLAASSVTVSAAGAEGDASSTVVDAVAVTLDETSVVLDTESSTAAVDIAKVADVEISLEKIANDHADPPASSSSGVSAITIHTAPMPSITRQPRRGTLFHKINTVLESSAVLDGSVVATPCQLYVHSALPYQHMPSWERHALGYRSESSALLALGSWISDHKECKCVSTSHRDSASAVAAAVDSLKSLTLFPCSNSQGNMQASLSYSPSPSLHWVDVSLLELESEVGIKSEGQAEEGDETIREEKGSILAYVDSLARQLYDAAPPSSCLIILTQGDLAPLRFLSAKKQRIRWEMRNQAQELDAVSAAAKAAALNLGEAAAATLYQQQQYQLLPRVQRKWGEAEEKSLADCNSDAMKGALFVGFRR